MPEAKVAWWVRWGSLLLIWLFLGPSRGLAAPVPKRIALLVGVSKYSAALNTGHPPAGFVRHIDDLVAPPADVERMRAILAERYKFQVTTLLEEQANRDAILKTLRDQLAAAGPSGFFVFYYSGHGSYIRNTATGQKDQTIVPADAAIGAQDIRDKQLGRMFREAALRGSKVTAIFDSCYSGSMTRALTPGEQPRQVEPYPGQVHDPPGPTAASADVLMLGAARSDQLAYENRVNSETAGVFSRALAQTLASGDPDNSAQTVYERILPLMSLHGSGEQEPVLEASELRRGLALFGWRASGLPDMLEVPVSSIVDDSTVVLPVGLALNLEVGTELVRLGTASSTAPRVKIKKMLGLAASQAVIVAGQKSDFPPGTPLAVDKWAPPSRPSLLLRLGATLPLQALRSVARSLEALRGSSQVRWIADPTLEEPQYIVSWDGVEWLLSRPAQPPLSLGKEPTAAAVEAMLAAQKVAEHSARPSLFLSLPLPTELAPHLRPGQGKDAGRVAMVGAEFAHYALRGRWDGGSLSYAWVRENRTRSAVLSSPLRTQFITLPPEAGEETLRDVGSVLTKQTRPLARILSWLSLTPPEPSDFHYRLGFERRGEEAGMKGMLPVRKRPVTEPGSAVYEGEHFAMKLVRTASSDLRNTAHSQTMAASRYVYIFAIDTTGRTVLSFPGKAQGYSSDQALIHFDGTPSEIMLNDGVPNICIQPPAGIDTYFLLVSDAPLDDPRILQFSSGVTRATGRDELSNLLLYVGAEERGVKPPSSARTGFTLQRLPLTSLAMPGASGRQSWCK